MHERTAFASRQSATSAFFLGVLPESADKTAEVSCARYGSSLFNACTSSRGTDFGVSQTATGHSLFPRDGKRALFRSKSCRDSEGSLPIASMRVASACAETGPAP